MRVTSGKYKGREVRSPRDERTHPMGERERLALFNMLAGPGRSVLDAYAGSGALGIEALSRGARRVVFVEKAPAVARVIRENLLRLGVSEGATGLAEPGTQSSQVICADVKNLALDEKFDVILADPPYDDFDLTGVEKLTDLLEDGGVLVLSHPGVAPELPGLILEKTRQYARAHLSFYTK